MNRKIYAIFFLSGIAGLIYQVIWVREFGQIFGNTVQSAALISGIFLLGLGVGSYIAGKLIDRPHLKRPAIGLEYYAYAEFLIGLWGLMICLVLPHIEALSPLISSYKSGSNGWHELTVGSYLLRYLLAVAMIGPITFFMGTTLTLLIRFLLAHSTKEAGLKVGLLYGINTLGAALGCIIVDAWAVPAIGLFSTQLLAVACNLLAGFAAFRLSRSPNFASAKNEEASSEATGVLWPAGLAIFLSGASAMGMEIIWLRFLGSTLRSKRFVFSLLLTVLLVSMWLGSVVAGRFTKKYPGWAGRFYLFSQLAFAASVILSFFLYIKTDKPFSGDLGTANSYLQTLAETLFIVIAALKTVAIPAFFMGASFPLINDLVQTDSCHVGAHAGKIYLWNCTGALAGSIICGFVLLPGFGMKDTTAIFVLGAILATLPIFQYYKSKFSPAVGFRTASLTLLALAFTAELYWIFLPKNYLVENSFWADIFIKQRLITASEGLNETAVVLESEELPLVRNLFTNGHAMSGTSYGASRYMRAFTHIPLLQLEKPESVLVICFGVGNTLHSASLHPTVRNLEIVDLSKNVLDLAKNFEFANHGVLKDSRTQVFVNDGRQHLRMQLENVYDLITLEPPPLSHAGTVSLYTKEFYEIAWKTLKSGGFMSQWLPIYQVEQEQSKSLIKSFLEVFPNAVLLNGFNRELMLLGQKNGPNRIDWKAFQRRLVERGAVANDLKRIDMAKPEEWLGLYVGGGPNLKKAVEDVEPMADNYPEIEYNYRSIHTTLAAELFDVSTFEKWCPTCFNGKQLVNELKDLSNYLSLMQAAYHSDRFLKVPGDSSQRVPIPLANHNGSLASSIPHAMDKATIERMLNSYEYLNKFVGGVPK